MINKKMFKEWIRNNTPYLVVLAIGTAIAFVISGDVTAGTRGR